MFATIDQILAKFPVRIHLAHMIGDYSVIRYYGLMPCRIRLALVELVYQVQQRVKSVVACQRRHIRVPIYTIFVVLHVLQDLEIV